MTDTPGIIPVPQRRFRDRFSIGLPAHAVVRRLFWRPRRHNLWQYWKADVWYHAMQLVWAYGRRLAGQRRVERLHVDRVRVPIAGLPASFDDYHIVQLTDLHGGPPFPMYYLEHAVRLALQQPADVYVLTGDFITVWPEDAEPAAAVLAPLARHRPTYACLGNHDVWNDRWRVQRALEAHGIDVLVNRGVALERGDDCIWLAGVDDVENGEPDLAAALAGRPPGAATVLLAHEPDYAEVVAPSGEVDLQLSGHTHGGQIVLPHFGPMNLPELGRLYPPGLVRVQEMWVYTSRGVWASWPVRFNSPAEVSEIRLSCQEFSAAHRPPWRSMRSVVPRMRRHVSP